MTDAVLSRVEGVRVAFGDTLALRDATLELRRSQVTALVGPNGSGKTTLLKVLLGLCRPSRGRVVHAGGRRPRVGYVPQSDVSEPIFPVSALDVVLMGLTPELGPWRRARGPERARCRAALERFAVGDLCARRFTDLSGGQRQRVLLARAVVADPELLALDEPVRGLDFASAFGLMGLLRGLAHEAGMAVVVATHSLDLVANHADTVALFRHGECSSGPAHEMFTDEKLSEYHGTPVRVAEVEGLRVVLPGDITR